MERSRRLASPAAVPLFAILCALAPQISGQTRNTDPENADVDAAVCATCHPKQADRYARTGMGRSFYPLTSSRQVEDFSRGLPYFHAPSGTYYGMTLRDGRYYQSQYQLGFDAKKINFLEKQIDYVIGSGNHARTYVSRTARNTLVELPLAWYAEKGGYWAMNPGYDRPDHDGFSRPVSFDCVFCHNAYPVQPKVSGDESIFPARMPEGIDCQRCHGPGQAHVQAARNRQTAAIKSAIVNPALLPRNRQAEVCLQCHLETTSATLPNAIRRFDRGPFSYRPGEALTDFRLDFDFGSTHRDDFEIAGAAYQLDKSACMLKSQGKLSCTTCHDPHDVQHGVQATDRYNAICRNCHSASLDGLIAKARHTSTANCIDCHMPKRRTDDAVHVVMTDHRIQRLKPPGDLLAPVPERVREGPDAYHGEVVRYTPVAAGPSLAGASPAKADDVLYLAAAQVIQNSNNEAGIPRLAAAIRQFRPASADFYTTLADAERVTGDCEKAIASYEEALRRRAGDSLVVEKMAMCLSSTGQHAKAETVLRTAIKTAPESAKLWSQLGIELAQLGRSSEGITAFEKSTALDPDAVESWNNLAEALLELRDAARAEDALHNALRIQPSAAKPNLNLANLLAGTKRFDEAKYFFEAALRSSPNSATIHLRYGLAMFQARQLPEAQAQLGLSLQLEPQNPDAHHAMGLAFDAAGNRDQAIDEYRQALKLRPQFPLADFSLGFALLRAGKTSEALPFLKEAAAAPDGPVRQQAQRLLERITPR